MDALEELKKMNENNDVEWSGQARRTFERYPASAACYACKNGILRTSVGQDSGGRFDVYLTQYCRLLSMDVYTNEKDSDLVDVIQSCDGYDDSVDED